MKSFKTAVAVVSTLLLAASLAFGQATANPRFPANGNGAVMASEFGKWAFQSQTGISSGAQTVTLNSCYIKVGTTYELFYPIAVNEPLYITDGANSEAVTPTSVTSPTVVTGPSTVSPYNCSFTATFANSHLNPGFSVSSNDGGLEVAMNYAIAKGIGSVVIDSTSGITNTQIAAALVYPMVQLVDFRAPALPGASITDLAGVNYWNPQPSTLSTIAAPTVRAAVATCPSPILATTVCNNASTGGTWPNSAEYVCVTYIDLMGGESPCSTTANFTSGGTTSTIFFAAPAASTGAVGWRAYAGLAYATTAYQLPLSSTTCTLTTLETTVPACAVTNALYGQVGSSATFTTPTVHTSLVPQAGGVAAAYNPNPISHQSFTYAPATHPYVGFEQSFGPFPTTVALTAGQSGVLGSVVLPPGVLNWIGQTLVLRGKVAVTPTTGATAPEIAVEIGDVTDFTTGTPNVACKLLLTQTVTTAANAINFECRLETNTTGTTGSVMPGGHIETILTAGTTLGAVAAEESTAALTADVLDADTLFIVLLQTSGAETTGPTLLDLHIDVL